MSRITEKPAVAPLDPFKNISTGVPNTAYAAVPATGAQPSTGVGTFEPDLDTAVGLKFDTSDGRTLVLVKNGTTALAAGVLVQSSAEVTAHQTLAMTVPAAYPATAGTYLVYVTNGSTVLNVNKFAGGYLIVCSGTGEGQMLKIASHQPAADSAKFVVTLEDPIQTTLDATSVVSLLANPYANVVVCPATKTGTPVGISLYGISASTAATYNATSGKLTANGVAQYGLIVCHGPTACIIDSTTTVGYPLGPSPAGDSKPGQLKVATLTDSPQIGISAQTQTDTYYGLVNVML